MINGEINFGKSFVVSPVSADGVKCWAICRHSDDQVWVLYKHDIAGLVQERRNSSALLMSFLH